MSVLSTMTRVFARYGSPLTINESGGTGRSVTGLVVPMDSGTVNTFFDGNESVGLTKPAFTLYLAGSEPNPPAPNDTFLYTDAAADTTNRMLTVRKRQAFRIAGALVLWECLCD